MAHSFQNSSNNTRLEKSPLEKSPLEKSPLEKSPLEKNYSENAKFSNNSAQFHKNLGTFSLVMLGVGALIGGGIFSVLGVISLFTGPFSYLAYIVMGLIALIVLQSYNRLFTVWGDSAGGEYHLLLGAFENDRKDVLGYYIGVLLYFGYIASMALYGYTFSIYFARMLSIPITNANIALIILGLVLFLSILNLRGVKEFAGVNNLLVITKILILTIFIVGGMWYASKHLTISQFDEHLGLDQEDIENFSIVGMLFGISTIVVSYQGFQLIGNAAMEMKDKERGLKTMKKALIISMIIYSLTAITALLVLGIHGILGQGQEDAELAIANSAEIFLGRYGVIFLSIGAILSTASAFNGTLLGTSRLAYEMANDKVFPRRMKHISLKYGVPDIAIVITAALSYLLAFFTEAALTIAELTDIIFIQIFFFVAFANFHARKKTGSNKITPIFAMLLTFLLFIALIAHYLITAKENVISLLIIGIIEFIAIGYAKIARKKHLGK